MVIVLYCLSGFFFALSIFFLIRAFRKKPFQERFEGKTIDEILAKREKAAESSGNPNPNSSELLLIQIMRNTERLNDILLFIASILFSGELLIVALLWTLK